MSYRVLVASSRARIADVKEALRTSRYQVQYTANGIDAHSVILEAHAVEEPRPFAFDLLVLDTRLPGMTGLEIAATLADEEIDLPPIIFVSIWHDPAERREAERLGGRYLAARDWPDRLPSAIRENI